MRVSKVLGACIAMAAAAVALTSARPSRAGDEALLNVSCANGEVTVTTAKPWHINDKAPWKWDKGAKVTVDEQAAKFKGDKCEGTVKAFVCSADQCKGPIAVPVK